VNDACALTPVGRYQTTVAAICTGGVLFTVPFLITCSIRQSYQGDMPENGTDYKRAGTFYN